MMKKIALTPRCYKKRRRVNDTGIESLKSTVVKNLMSYDTVPLTPSFAPGQCLAVHQLSTKCTMYCTLCVNLMIKSSVNG